MNCGDYSSSHSSHRLNWRRAPASSLFPPSPGVTTVSPVTTSCPVRLLIFCKRFSITRDRTISVSGCIYIFLMTVFLFVEVYCYDLYPAPAHTLDREVPGGFEMILTSLQPYVHSRYRYPLVVHRGSWRSCEPPDR